uniref:DDB1- and CUL4-associated factor 17 n=1 Tax=Strigamia maritima TaxID=126957 RepID=T1ISC5_STRMM
MMGTSVYGKPRYGSLKNKWLTRVNPGFREKKYIYMGGHRKNIIEQLIRKEIGVKSNFHHNVKMLNNLLCSESRTFQLLWETHSKQPIYYENQRIYLENYRVCYTINGLELIPSKLYALPTCSPSYKIQEGLICASRLVIEFFPKKGHGPYFLGLVADGWLRRYDIDTGEIMEEIFLSLTTRFKYLTWNEEAHTVIVKSILKNNYDPTEIVTLCIFSLFPLDFVAKLKVYTKIFGKDVNDAVISEGLLCVSHTSGFVRLYSLKHIMKSFCKYKISLGKHCKELGGATGGHPFGLPLNIQISKKPPVLFEVRCANSDVKMGGFPWHYLIMPWKDRTIFEVYSLETNQLAQDGTLQCSTLAIRPDRSLFHPDDSGRIIHLTASELRLFSICIDDGICSLKPNFIIDTTLHKPDQKQKTQLKTRSGRTIRQRRNLDMTCSAFEVQSLVTFSYEDELDLLVVLGAHNFNFENEPITDQVYLYDNKFGKLLKKIQLKPYLIEHLENNIMLDRDVIVNTRKDMNGSHSCYVYRLKGD